MIARPASVDEKGRLISDDVFREPLKVFVGMLSRLKRAGSFDGMTFIERRLQNMETMQGCKSLWRGKMIL